MDLVQRNRSLPPSRSKQEKAVSFLSEWFSRNSFFPEGSAEDDDGGGEDPPGRTGRVVGRGVNGSDDGREGNEKRVLGGSGSDNGSEGVERGDFGISIGQIVGGDDFEVYEDRDRFSASTSTNNLTDYLPTSLKDANASKGDGKFKSIAKGKGRPRSHDDGDEEGPKPQVVGRPPNTSSDKNGNNNKGGPKPPIVTRLPWRDQRGILGKYTGQTDRLMRPHGRGALIYEDGSYVTCIWEDGVPIKSWAPGDKKKRKQQSSSSNGNGNGNSNSNRNWTYLPHLDLGDVGAPQDTTRLDSGQSAFSEILNAQLQVHDFAFVLRSDGRWTYAIVAEKKEEAMMFVVDGDGGAKTLARKRWAASIRLVNLNEARRSQGGLRRRRRLRQRQHEWMTAPGGSGNGGRGGVARPGSGCDRLSLQRRAAQTYEARPKIEIVIDKKMFACDCGGPWDTRSCPNGS